MYKTMKATHYIYVLLQPCSLWYVPVPEDRLNIEKHGSLGEVLKLLPN